MSGTMVEKNTEMRYELYADTQRQSEAIKKEFLYLSARHPQRKNEK
jgi:hypothetical protein